MNNNDRKLVLDLVTEEISALDPDSFESATAVYGDPIEDSDGQDDDIETSDDLLAEHNCSDPGGHVFLSECGIVRCIHCPKEG